MKCPKCGFENPPDLSYCGKCGTQIQLSKDIPITKTIETPKEELTTGSTFANKYQIIEELGRGGMGRVYKALDTEVNEKVAIKLIKPEIAADKKTIERFRNELKFARKIRHKNVCQMFDLNKEEGSYYITMEYVAGEDLKGLSKKMGQLSAGQTISIAKQICDGLEEAHKLGVVHRDLKPQNIMIDKEGDARIMDFGIARSIEGKSITGAGVMIGTPDYMSPEQVDGKETDQRSDIYSLGIILYEMITGQTPFEGDTPFTIGVKHKSETPRAPKELNSQIPDDLNHVILKCLEKEKENRYQSTGELQNELTNIQKGFPTTERIVPDRKPLTSREITVQFSLKKLLIPALIIIAVAAIGIIIWQMLPQQEIISAPKIENSIAIISFNNRTGDTAFDYLQDAIPNLLITSLEQTGYFYVATWERMHDLLKQMGKENISLIDSDLGFELCRREGIQAIVLGSFTKAGDMFATDVKILDVDNKKLLKSGSSKGEGVSSILKTQIDELSREISQGIGMPAAKFDETQKSIIDVTTSSMEAYNYFLKGSNELAKLYYEDAIKLLEKAVELDPTFAVAQVFLGVAYGNSGNTKGRNEAFENAKKYSEKASDKERLWIEAIYAHYIGRDREKAIDLLEQLVEKYPREDFLHHDLGNIYRLSRRYKEAIEEFTKALELDPNYGLAMNHMAYTYSAMEEYEKAIEYLQKYSSLSPEDANPQDSMGEIYLMMGNLDESIAKYKEASEIKPGLGSDWKLGYAYALKQDYVEAMKWADKQISRSLAQGDKAIGHWWKGFYLYWLGNTEKALDSIDIAEKMATELGNLTLKRAAIWMKGMVHLERGETEASRKCVQTWFDLVDKSPSQLAQRPTVYYKFSLGLVDLREGRIDDAKSKLKQMELLLPEIEQAYKARLTAYYNYLKGELLLGEGKVEEIINLYKAEVIPRGLTTITYMYMALHNVPFLNDVLSRAYAKKGDADKAIEEYERLITFDPSRKERRVVHPKYYYRLAKLYQEKGWAGKAIENYEKFLELWKYADPGLPEVEDAKTRLREL